MEEKRSWWQKIKRLLVVVGIIVACMLGIALIIGIIGGYLFNWGWTGIKTKTLWDWLNLLGVLAIPVVVGFGAVWFTTRQGIVADAENTDNQRETALQAYIDKMSDLMLTHNLRESVENEEVRNIARIRTLTVLRSLDAKRKGSVLLFLQESGLISKDNCVINLNGADLREVRLFGPDLKRLNLSGVHFSRADLRGVSLYGADLSYADLMGANLSYVGLREANLRSADLREANLSRAWLSEADLSVARLSGANMSNARLSGANMSNADLCMYDFDKLVMKRADLSGADLSGANMSDAYLMGANLKGANLSGTVICNALMDGANMSGALLSGADLSGANLGHTLITSVQLRQAKSLKGATMPDGSIHD